MNEFEEKVCYVAKESRVNKELIAHGWPHTIQVIEYAKMIVRSIDASLEEDVIIAAAFHDVSRVDDECDPTHGVRSAEIAQKLIPKYFPEADLKSILFAIKHHCDFEAQGGGVPVVANYDLRNGINPIIAMCLWDGDRLDLLRLQDHPVIYTEYLNTDFAKSYANSEEHMKRYKSKNYRNNFS